MQGGRNCILPARSSQHDQHLPTLHDTFKIAQDINADFLSETKQTLDRTGGLQPGVCEVGLVIGRGSIPVHIHVPEGDTGRSAGVPFGVSGDDVEDALHPPADAKLWGAGIESRVSLLFQEGIRGTVFGDEDTAPP